MATAYLVPTPGMKVRNPQGGYLKDTGETILMTSYWRRRVAEGGCASVEKPRDPVHARQAVKEALTDHKPNLVESTSDSALTALSDLAMNEAPCSSTALDQATPDASPGNEPVATAAEVQSPRTAAKKTRAQISVSE